MKLTYTPETLVSASVPTFYFIGVSTGSSSIRTVFPRWAEALGLGDVRLVGIDLPLHAAPERYRRVVSFLRSDPLSLGALVTTHKIDMYRSASDLFDRVDPLADLMGEVSCLAMKGDELHASAKDPHSSGLAIDEFAPADFWRRRPRDLFLMGAGGSAIAIDWYLTRPDRGDARPARVIVSNRSAPRLETMREIHGRMAPDIPFMAVQSPSPELNDQALATLAPGAMVVNATGLGKDAPGSPLTDAAIFPPAATVWELNYRGDLVFLDQARRQQAGADLTVEDGWVYFLHGWTQVISEVFDIEIDPRSDVFGELAAIAESARG
tara:strand:- start:530 stop:1498 length:969 start_codon:yes stop_codon:yes gene_type:complete